MRPRIRNITNAAEFGVEWTTHDCCFRLRNPFGTKVLIFGIRTGRDQPWTTSPIANPNLYGLKRPLITFEQFKTIAKRYRDTIGSLG